MAVVVLVQMSPDIYNAVQSAAPYAFQRETPWSALRARTETTGADPRVYLLPGWQRPSGYG